MPKIMVLDSETIDKIAAGEVVERPSSVVKELVENAIDAGAKAVAVEIKDGGVSLVRVTDNGCGMEADQVKSAFLRHATSKIRKAEDLERIVSLGFRGEALSSIAAVSRVELITKPQGTLTGTRLSLEGGNITGFEEVGAPDGTTFIMRNLFFNTPVRKKFLKQAPTEAGYVTDLMEHLALSRPDISFQFTIGNQMRFHTSGNGDLKEVIYRIYGREIANAVVPIQVEKDGITIEGYLGKPILVRSNRNFEIYFMNGRFIKSIIIAKAIEEGYSEYLMQHKFPFCVLHIHVDPQRVDVNVHPTKMDVRFQDSFLMTQVLAEAVRTSLKAKEMIPQDNLSSAKENQKAQQEQNKARFREQAKEKAPEPFEQNRLRENILKEDTAFRRDVNAGRDFRQSPVWERVQKNQSPAPEKKVEPVKKDSFFEEAEPLETPGKDESQSAAFDRKQDSTEKDSVLREMRQREDALPATGNRDADQKTEENADTQTAEEKPRQLDLFEEKILTRQNRAEYQIIGQVFDTYWMFQYHDKLCILDQHAAHEKVKYERFIKHFREKEIVSQRLMPPVIVSLTGQEEVILKECMEVFGRMGFEIESFGGNEYAIRAVPADLYGCSEKEMFLEILDDLESGVVRKNPKVVEERIATMACKAAVKGNNRLSYEEADRLIDELLSLENPYNCPHGRPTIITISKYEMEKKFKRIVT